MAIVASGSVALGEFKQLGFWFISATEPTVVTMSGLSADIDLYVRYGTAPTRDDWDCRPYLGGTDNEFCNMPLSGADRIYIAVDGYEAGTYEIDITPFITTDPTEFSPGEISQIAYHLQSCNYAFRLSDIKPPAYGGATIIRQILVRVEAAYDLTQLNSTVKIQWEEKLIQQDTVTQTVRPDSTTTTTYGDRVTKEFYYPSYQKRISAYHREVERLATALGIIYG